MDIRNRRELTAAARESLAGAAYDPRKLILIHTGVALALSFLVTALDFILGTQIENTGGLGGMDLRSILSTAQSVLRLVNLVVLPFWEVGYTFAALKLARREKAEPASLLEGFRRWGPFLRSLLLQAVIYLGICIACFYLALQIFMVTPLSNPLYQILTPYVSQGQIVLDEAAYAAATEAMMPGVIIFAILYVIVVTPVTYSYRMVDYALLDDPKAGALAAMRSSRRMMRCNRFRLFRLDLSFWWFYVVQTLLVVVCYGDMLLPMLGIALPFSETVSYFLFYVLSLMLQLVLYAWLRNGVTVTYAHAYEALREEPEQVVTPPEQKNQPWDYQ